jgi:voltage-gated potassium channel
LGLRRRVWEIVEVAAPGDRASRTFDITILTLIGLSVLAVIFGSVESVEARWGPQLYVFEVITVAVFSVEYIARLWSCVEDERYADGLRGRLRWAFSFMAIIDLLAILPFFLPFTGIDLRSLRALRLFRLARVAKVGRYYSSLSLIKNVFRARKEELVLTTVLMGLLLIVSASLLYYVENPVQPEVFSSIPATMWWAVATLTTVGYGDMFPVTALGKVLAGVIAIIGIGMFALPTGILGAGFVEEIGKSKAECECETCPHCGAELT